MSTTLTQPQTRLAKLLDLSGCTAIVTGGAAGIGQAIALRLAEAGAHVVVCDLDEAGGQATSQAAKSAGHSAAFQKLDVADAGAVAAAVESLAGERGRIDILVNNAGIYPMRPFAKSDDSLWQKTLEVNLLGAVRLCRAALPHLQKAAAAGGSPSIVNIASIEGLRPAGTYLVHYSASKGALISMTRSLAWELRGLGVRVNGVAPGAIETPGTAALRPVPKDDAERQKLESMERAFLGRIPVKRRGAPDDVARAVLFLASPFADYITGEILVVDGGYMLS